MVSRGKTPCSNILIKLKQTIKKCLNNHPFMKIHFHVIFEFTWRASSALTVRPVYTIIKGIDVRFCASHNFKRLVIWEVRLHILWLHKNLKQLLREYDRVKWPLLYFTNEI